MTTPHIVHLSDRIAFQDKYSLHDQEIDDTPSVLVIAGITLLALCAPTLIWAAIIWIRQGR